MQINEINQYAKHHNKYMKNYDKNKESSYLKYWDVDNSSDWAMLQKLPVNNLEWIEYLSSYNKQYHKKTIMKNAMKDIFSKLM